MAASTEWYLDRLAWQFAPGSTGARSSLHGDSGPERTDQGAKTQEINHLHGLYHAFSCIGAGMLVRPKLAAGNLKECPWASAARNVCRFIKGKIDEIDVGRRQSTPKTEDCPTPSAAAGSELGLAKKPLRPASTDARCRTRDPLLRSSTLLRNLERGLSQSSRQYRRLSQS